MMYGYRPPRDLGRWSMLPWREAPLFEAVDWTTDPYEVFRPMTPIPVDVSAPVDLHITRTVLRLRRLADEASTVRLYCADEDRPRLASAMRGQHTLAQLLSTHLLRCFLHEDCVENIPLGTACLKDRLAKLTGYHAELRAIGRGGSR